MNALFTEIIGYAAAFFGTIIMVPQLYKTIKTKHVADLSLSMLVVYIINCTLWGVYGVLIGSMPIMLCNTIALLIGITQTVLKFRYSHPSA